VGFWPDSNRAAVHRPALRPVHHRLLIGQPVLVSQAHFRRVLPTSMTKTMLILLPRRDATGTVDGDKARKDTISRPLGYFLHGVLVRELVMMIH